MATPFTQSASDVVLDAQSAFAEFLVKSGFSTSTRTRSATVIHGFSNWLMNTEYSTVELYESSAAYLCQRTGITETTRNGYRFHLNRFLRYLRTTLELPVQSEETEFSGIETEFGNWLRQVREVGTGTVDLRLGYLRRFLAWCSENALAGPELLERLVPSHIEAFFIEAEALPFGRAFHRSLRTCIRQFLQFCFEREYCERELSGSVPCFRSYRQAHVPRAIAEADAQTLLAGISQETTSGIRDYAIIRLLYEYGVRAVQVASLRLTDIDWHAGEIFFAAAKRGKSCQFPLTSCTGDALLAYLKTRPDRLLSEVFSTLRAPYGPLNRSSAISEIVRRRLKQLEINTPVSGAHGFRHALAKRLLQKGTPLKHIADLLGHRCLQTTFIYTKVDFSALAEVAIELPEVVL